MILDESINIGEQKILLVLGIKLSDYTFTKPLDFQDVHVLTLKISKSWNGVEISKILKSLLSTGYNVKYVISDGCSTLKKAIALSGLSRVSDCTHAFGNILKRHYEKNEAYIAFDKLCGKLKRQVNLGKNAVIAPPKYRKKAKFLNLWERSKWAYRMLELLEVADNQNGEDVKLSSDMIEKLSFLKEHRTLIRQLYSQCETINKLHKVLKTKGLSRETITECTTILKQLNKVYSENKNEKDFFTKGIEQYFLEQQAILKKLETTSMICNSDIIESMFGKYKERAKRSGGYISDDCLNMANFSQNFTEKEVKQAMENVKIIDIVEWRKQNCKDSLRAKKQKLFENTKNFCSKRA